MSKPACLMWNYETKQNHRPPALNREKKWILQQKWSDMTSLLNIHRDMGQSDKSKISLRMSSKRLRGMLLDLHAMLNPAPQHTQDWRLNNSQD